MNSLFYDYKFKTEASKKQWKDFLANIDEEIRLSYMGRISTLSILINFNKCFNITPYSLHNSDKLEDAEYRIFALYLLIHYSNETLDDIANGFNTSIDELQSIRSNQDLHLEYEEKIKIFFEPLKENFIESKRASLALSEVMQEVMDKEISDEMSVMLYDDLATLTEGVVSVAIESGKITQIYFYDAYRALDELNEALYDVVDYIGRNFDFQYPINQTFSFASPEAKWFKVINDYLEQATQKTRAFLFHLGTFYCMDERSRFLLSPMERFYSKDGYRLMIKNDYQGDKIEQEPLIFTRTVLLMPEFDQPIDQTNQLKLPIIRENIRESSVRERLKSEGLKSFYRLNAVRMKMEDYLMENVSIKELFPRNNL